MAEQALTISDYSLVDLREVVEATDGSGWKLRKHPERDAYTVTSRHGFVIHPGLGYVNDEVDAAFISTFDPPMVRSLLDRIAELESAAVSDPQHRNGE